MNTPRLFALLTLSLIIFSENSYAEISGSGFRQEGCNSKIDLRLYVDVNGNGRRDSSDLNMEGVSLSITRVSEPEAGTDTLFSDSNGNISFFNLCPTEYLVEMQSFTLESGLRLSVMDVDGDYTDQLSAEEAGFSLYLPVTPSGSDSHRNLELGFENISCDVELVAGCSVAVTQSASNVPSTPDYECKKDLKELTMIWNGDDVVRVVAHRGKLDDPVMADIDNILPGAEVKIDGLAGAPHDIIWEIFSAGTSTKIGESSFHLSCSDNEMNDPLDCGKSAGDGKNDDKCSGGDGSCLNDWIFEGLVDQEGEINCTEDYPTNQLASEWSSCEISGSGVVDFQYSLIAGSEAINIHTVSDSELGALPGVPPEALVPGESASFYYSDQVVQSELRQLNITGLVGSTGQSCIDSTVIEVEVLPAPSSCDLMGVRLENMDRDKLELEITNQGTDAMTLTGFTSSWPEENDKLKEIKTNGSNVLNAVIPWQEVVYVSELDFSEGPESRLVEAGDVLKLELKFDEQVHDSQQVYDIDFDFGADCSVNYNNIPPPLDSVQCELVGATLESMAHDKVKLEIGNQGTHDVVMSGLILSWPEENDMLSEIKTDDGQLLSDSIVWQDVVSLAESDFSVGPGIRTIKSGGVQTLELKFTQHVHNSEQVYDINIDLGDGCIVHFSNTEN